MPHVRVKIQISNTTVERNRGAVAGWLSPRTCRRPVALPSRGAVIERPEACRPVGTTVCPTHRRMAMTARRRRLREDRPRRGLSPRTPPGARDAVTHLAPHDRRAPEDLSDEARRPSVRSWLTEQPVAERP